MKISGKLLENIPLKYAAIAVLPLISLLWVPIVNFTVLLAGESVLLETLPVDPTDFLRGDYVILNYKISNISGDLVPPDINDSHYRRPRQAVYAALERDAEGIGHVKSVSSTRPGGLYLRGSQYYRHMIDYDGINAYYVPEGMGREIERRINDSDVLVDVRVFHGHAAINGLVFTEKDEDGVRNGEEDE
ncbi:MAG: GDYXXLXY domain-containing protein [Synergistaceae bacterium]|nr:GDYXXLXY domain-containing protein [Synergistaceae bacterium]